MKTAEEDKALQFLKSKPEIYQDLYEKEREEIVCALMEEYASQNTLNRDKVMDMFDSLLKDVNKLHSGNVAHQKTHLLGTLTWWKEHLCSLSLPTLSEGEIEEAWQSYLKNHKFKHYDRKGELHWKNGFKAALNSLTNKEEER